MASHCSLIHRMLALCALVVLVVTACGTSDEATDTTTTVGVTTTAEVTTTTTVASTTTAPTTTTSQAETALAALGFPVSDDWVVETVVTDIDSGTGGLAVMPDGTFLLGDFGYTDHVGDTVWRVTRNGDVTPHAQSDDMQSLTMTVLADDGTVYQSSYNSNRVFRIDPDGTPEVIAEGLRGPTGIVLADDGTLYVEACNSNTIHTIAPDGTVEDFAFDRRFNCINGLTQGPDGTLYAVNFKDGGLLSVSPEGEVDKLFQFPEPTAHGVYLDGSLYVTSRLGYVVFRYDLGSGDVEIIAGNGEPGDRDGRGGEASFGRPNAITLGPDGALYINHGTGAANDPVTIRRISFQP